MSDNRRPAWGGIGLLSLAFGTAMVALTKSGLTTGRQAFWMIVVVVIFYVLLGTLANWREDFGEARDSHPTPKIIYPIESPVQRVSGHPATRWTDTATSINTSKTLSYEEN